MKNFIKNGTDLVNLQRFETLHVLFLNFLKKRLELKKDREMTTHPLNIELHLRFMALEYYLHIIHSICFVYVSNPYSLVHVCVRILFAFSTFVKN